MKPQILLISLLLFLTTSCQLLGINADETIENYIKDFSDIRPYPNVLSEKEVLRIGISNLFIEHYQLINNILSTDSKYKDVKIGDVVLVEDYISYLNDIYPYY